MYYPGESGRWGYPPETGDIVWPTEARATDILYVRLGSHPLAQSLGWAGEANCREEEPGDPPEEGGVLSLRASEGMSVPAGGVSVISTGLIVALPMGLVGVMGVNCSGLRGVISLFHVLPRFLTSRDRSPVRVLVQNLNEGEIEVTAGESIGVIRLFPDATGARTWANLRIREVSPLAGARGPEGWVRQRLSVTGRLWGQIPLEDRPNDLSRLVQAHGGQAEGWLGSERLLPSVAVVDEAPVEQRVTALVEEMVQAAAPPDAPELVGGEQGLEADEGVGAGVPGEVGLAGEAREELEGSLEPASPAAAP